MTPREDLNLTAAVANGGDPMIGVIFKMNVPASDNLRSTIVQIFKELLRELNQIDSDSSILSWHSKAKSEPLTSTTAMPLTATGLHCYMHKLYVPSKGDKYMLYPHICIGHDIAFQAI